MWYKIGADVVLIVHFAFVLFVIFGGVLVLRWPRVVWAHVPIAIYGATIEFIGFVCPLTPLENALRRRGGEAGYSGGFIEHYITATIYPSGLTRGIQVALGVGVVVLNGVVYTIAIARALDRARGRDDGSGFSANR
jgi:uncharacterized protein DUF2784